MRCYLVTLPETLTTPNGPEYTVVFTVPVEETTGVLVSLDRQTEFTGRTVIETVEAIVEMHQDATN